jgi:hypothetical protein
MFGNRRRQHGTGEQSWNASTPTSRLEPSGASPMGVMPGGSERLTSHHDLDESAPLYTLPMPYDVAADHESIMVFVTESGPITEFSDIQASCLERLAKEASRRACDAVYGIQQSIAATDGLILISLLGTGARPMPDLDRPAGIPGT